MSTNMSMLIPETTHSHFNNDAYQSVNAISGTACTCQRIDQFGAPAEALGARHVNRLYTQQSWDIDVHDSGLSSSINRNNDSTALAAWQPAWLGFWMSKIGRKVNAADIALFRSLLGVTEEAVRLCLQEWPAYGNMDHMHTCKAVQGSSFIPLEHTIPTTTQSMNLLRVGNTRNDVDCAALTHQSLQSHPIEYRTACSSSGSHDGVQHKFTGSGHNSRGKESYVEQPVQIHVASTLDLASGSRLSVSTKEVRDLINQTIARQATKGCGRIRGHENQRGKYPCTLGCGRRFKNSADAFRHEEIVYPQQFFFDVTRGDPGNPSEKDLFTREDKMRQRLKKANDTSITLDQCRVSNIQTLWPERCGLCTHHRHPNWKERSRHILWHCRRGDFNTNNRGGGSSPSAELTQSPGDDDEDDGDDDEHPDADEDDDQHDGPEDPTNQGDGPEDSDLQRDDHGHDHGNNDYDFPPWSDDDFDTWFNNSSDMWKYSKTLHIECVDASINSCVTAKVLKIVAEEVNVNMSELVDETAFVDLGVDSLLWVTIIARLREELTIDIPLSLFFRCSTLGELKKHFAQLEDDLVTVNTFRPDLMLRNARLFSSNDGDHGHLVYSEAPNDRKVDFSRRCKQRERLLSQLARARNTLQVESTRSISDGEEVVGPIRKHATLDKALETHSSSPEAYPRASNDKAAPNPPQPPVSPDSGLADTTLSKLPTDWILHWNEESYRPLYEQISTGILHWELPVSVATVGGGSSHSTTAQPTSGYRKLEGTQDTGSSHDIRGMGDYGEFTAPSIPFPFQEVLVRSADAFSMSLLSRPSIALDPPSQLALANIPSALQAMNTRSPLHGSPIFPYHPQRLSEARLDGASDASSPYTSVSGPSYLCRRRASTRSSRAHRQASDFSIEERSAPTPTFAPISKSSRFQCTSSSHEKPFTRKADWRRHEIEIHGEKSKEHIGCLDSSDSFSSPGRPPQYNSALCGYSCGWGCCPELDADDASIETHGPKLSAVIHGTQDVASPGGVTTCKHCNQTFVGRYQRGNWARHVRQNHSDKDTLVSTTFACRVCKKAFMRQDARRKHEWKKHGFEDTKPPSRRPIAYVGTSNSPSDPPTSSLDGLGEASHVLLPCPQAALQYDRRATHCDQHGHFNDRDEYTPFKRRQWSLPSLGDTRFVIPRPRKFRSQLGHLQGIAEANKNLRPHTPDGAGEHRSPRMPHDTTTSSAIQRQQPRTMGFMTCNSTFGQPKLSRSESIRDSRRWYRSAKRSHPSATGNMSDKLYMRDHLYLIDNSKSMNLDWQRLSEVLELLVNVARRCDPDGIDLDFVQRARVPKDIWAYEEGDPGSLIETSPRVCPRCARAWDHPVGAWSCREPGESEAVLKYLGEPSVDVAPKGPHHRRKEAIFVLSDGIWTSSSYGRISRIATRGRITKTYANIQHRVKPHRDRTRDGCLQTWRICGFSIVHVKHGNDESPRSARTRDIGTRVPHVLLCRECSSH